MDGKPTILFIILFGLVLSCSPPHTPGPSEGETGVYVRDLTFTTSGMQSGWLISNYNYIHSTYAMQDGSNINGVQINSFRVEFYGNTLMRFVGYYPNDSVNIANHNNTTTSTNFLIVNPTPFIFYDTNTLHIIIQNPENGKVYLDEKW